MDLLICLLAVLFVVSAIVFFILRSIDLAIDISKQRKKYKKVTSYGED